MNIRRLILGILIVSGAALVFAIVLVLKPEYSSSFPFFRESIVALATAAMVFATLMLAYATFGIINSEREKEKRDRREHLLNEIIDWAAKVTTWRSENKPVLREIAHSTDVRQSQRLIHAHVGEVQDQFAGIIGLSEYVTKVASHFKQGLPETIEKLVSDMKAYTDFLEEWQHRLATTIESGRVDKTEEDSEGYDNSTIAENLNYQVSTVEQNLNRIYSKFETSTSFKGMTKRVVAARLFLIANGQLSNFDIGHMR